MFLVGACGTAAAIALVIVGAWPLENFVYGGSNAKWLAIVCLIAFVLRSPFLFVPTVPISDFRTYLQSARHLASGAGYDNIVYPPGEAAWLSAFIRIFGDHMLVVTSAQILAGILTIVLIFYGLRGYSHAAGRWAALSAAFYPSLVLWDGTLGHEVLDLFFLSLLLFTLSKAIHGHTVWWTVMGLLGGLSALTWPVMMALPAFVVLSLWFTGFAWRRIIVGGGLFLFAMALVVGAWTYRNYRVWHEFCLISANFGSILYRCNNAEGDGIHMEYAPGHPQRSGMIEYDHECMAAGADYIMHHPIRFAKLTAKRIVFLWGSDASMLDSLLAEYPVSWQRILKFLGAGLLQSFWGFLIGAWLIAAWKQPLRSAKNIQVLWCLFVLGIIGSVHAIVEPFTRHHLAAIPFLTALVLPAYQKVLNGSRRPGALSLSWLIRELMPKFAATSSML
jgi:4-amino-4-deoxy-L-arabinose transferase-like glycosyltransferase